WRFARSCRFHFLGSRVESFLIHDYILAMISEGPRADRQTITRLIDAHLRKVFGVNCKVLRIELNELGGGLDSLGVVHVRARVQGPNATEKMKSFVVKRTSTESPEARIHQEIIPATGLQLAPMLLAFEKSAGEHVYFFEY